MKTLFVIGGVLLGLVIAALIGVGYFMGDAVKSGINRYGPKLTQAKVELASAQLSPLSGSGTLTGLTVGNPAGWSDGRAFYLGKVQVDVEPMSVFGDHVVINEIVIDAPEFNYETKIFSSNIKDLLKNIEEFTGSGQAVTAKSGHPVKFVVKKFRLTNGKATVGLGANILTVTLPPISMDNLGAAEGGITADQLAGAIMKQVLGSIVSASAGALGQLGSASGSMTVEQLKEAAKNAGDTIKKMFKEGK